ncbi:MAG: sugar phosphate isomerase/epimerase family protein [Spirochaetota bacterium]
MRISCSTTIGHRLSLDEALDRIADLGFAEIDLLAAHGWAHVSPRDLVDDFAATSAEIRTSLESRGLAIAALNVAFSGPLYGRSEDDVARRHDEGLAVVNLMEAFDVDVAAVQPGGRPHGIADATLIEDAAASWAELTALAAEKSRTLALELHTGSPFDSPDAARALINRVPETRFAFDPSHLVGQGIDLHQVAWLLDRAAHVHLRDAESGRVQVRFGRGTVDFDWILEHLSARNYDGFVAVEYLDTDEFDVSESSRALAEKIRPYLSA